MGENCRLLAETMQKYLISENLRTPWRHTCMNGPFSRSRIFLQGLGVEKVQAQGFKCLLTHQIESLTQFLLGWLKVNKLWNGKLQDISLSKVGGC